MDGFVASRGGLKVNGTVAVGFAFAGILVGLIVALTFGGVGVPIGIIIATSASYPTVALIDGGRMLALEVEVAQPRVHCTVGSQVRTALITHGAVSVGPKTIDVDPVEGPALRIPTAGLTAREIDELVELLRAAASGDGGSSEEVPSALREVQDERLV